MAISGKFLKKALTSMEMTQDQAAHRLGVSRQTLNSWCSKSELTVEIIDRVKTRLKIDLTRYSDSNQPIVNNDAKGVPYYDMDVTASFLESFNDIQERPEFYIDFKPLNDCDAYFPVFGDSMYPRFQAGDIIAIKKLRNPNIILWGDPYVVVTDDEANNLRTLKLIFQHEDEDKIILRSCNPVNPGDTIINKKNIINMFIVKGQVKLIQL